MVFIRVEFRSDRFADLVGVLVEEMWHGSNIAFALCPMLTRGVLHALELVGSDELKAAYLPKLVSGEWTGTMVLTEPQAGSDLSAVRTRAVKQADGSYKSGRWTVFWYGLEGFDEIRACIDHALSLPPTLKDHGTPVEDP